MSRYKVATVTGYGIGKGAQKGNARLGLTASVLDTAVCHREVRRFRSEDRGIPGRGTTRGIEGAVKAAEDYAAKLNAATTG